MSRRRRRRSRPDLRNPLYLLEVLDRILDKGIVIDAWVGVSVLGIDLLAVDAHVVVASLGTYLRYDELAGPRPPGTGPPGGEHAGERPDAWAPLPNPEAAVRAAEEYLRRLYPGDPSDPPSGALAGRGFLRGGVSAHGR